MTNLTGEADFGGLANMTPEVAPVERPKYRLACLRCSWNADPGFLIRCPECGGVVDAQIALTQAKVRRGSHPEETYQDFLPIHWSQARLAGLSVRTPCRPAPVLGRAIGLPRLWVKDESGQPTGSVKDRLAGVVLAVFRDFGINEWVASGTGNSSTALARAVDLDGESTAHFFCGRDFVSDHRMTVHERVKLTVVDGDYAEASAAAKAFASHQGLTWEGGFYNWARREGLKIGYLEAFDAMEEKPDVVVQAVSSGMGILAARKGAAEYLGLGRMLTMPQFLMVQQDTCAPMANAWRDGRAELTDADVVTSPVGLARAILRGDATDVYPYLHDIAMQTDGSITSVTQDEMLESRRMLRELEGLDVCYSSAATVAAAGIEARYGRINPDRVVLLTLTGRLFS